MIQHERNFLTRWSMEKCCGLKAASIVFVRVCQAGAAAVDAIDIGVAETHYLNKKKTVNNL